MMIVLSQKLLLSLSSLVSLLSTTEAINIPRLVDHVPGSIAPKAYGRSYQDSNNAIIEPRFFKKYGSKRVVMKYGPYVAPSSTDGNGMKEFQDPASEKPCSDCLILALQAGLEYPNGTVANSNTGMWLHHGALYDFGRQDIVCPSMPYRFFASGNERTFLDMTTNGTSKTGFPLLGSSNMGVTVELMNELPYEREAILTIDFEYIPDLRKDFHHLDALWLDVTGACGDSDIEVPPNKQFFVYTAPDIIMKSSGNIIVAGGHLHDGGTLCRITKNSKTLCDFEASYGTSPGYIDPIGNSHMANKGGKSNTAVPGEPMLHISKMPLCFNPGSYKYNDTIGIIAHYNATKHPLMLGEKGGYEPVMGIAMVYVDNLDPVGPVKVLGNATSNSTTSLTLTMSSTTSPMVSNTIGSLPSTATVNATLTGSTSKGTSSSVVTVKSPTSIIVSGSISANSSSLRSTMKTSTTLAPTSTATNPRSSTTAPVSSPSTQKVSTTSSSSTLLTSTSATPTTITTGPPIPATPIPLTFTVPAGAILTIVTLYTSTITSTSTVTSTYTYSTIYVPPQTKTITSHITTTTTRTSIYISTAVQTSRFSTITTSTATATAYIIATTTLTSTSVSTMYTVYFPPRSTSTSSVSSPRTSRTTSGLLQGLFGATARSSALWDSSSSAGRWPTETFNFWNPFRPSQTSSPTYVNPATARFAQSLSDGVVTKTLETVLTETELATKVNVVVVRLETYETVYTWPTLS